MHQKNNKHVRVELIPVLILVGKDTPDGSFPGKLKYRFMSNLALFISGYYFWCINCIFIYLFFIFDCFIYLTIWICSLNPHQYSVNDGNPDRLELIKKL